MDHVVGGCGQCCVVLTRSDSVCETNMVSMYARQR